MSTPDRSSALQAVVARVHDVAACLELGAVVAGVAGTLPGRARDLGELVAATLTDGVDPLIPWSNAAAVLTEALGELISVADGNEPDDDAIDAHRQAVNALAPLDLGMGDEPPSPAEDPGAAERAEPGDELEVYERAPQLERPSADIVQVFQNEARELLSTCESGLLAMEADPGAPDAANALFRALHSFKGNCGFMGYRAMEQLAHRAESLLVLIKEGRRAADEPAVSALMYAVDALGAALDDPADDPAVPGLDALVAQLDALTGPPRRSANPTPPAEAPTPPRAAPAPVAVASPADEPAAAPEPPAADAASPETPAPDAPGLRLVADAEPRQRRAETTLRVDVTKLESLLDLMGELIIAGTAVRHLHISGPEAEDFARASAQLDRVVRSLQDVAMSLRMVPVGPTFRKMVRLTRDVSQRLGKPVELVMDGEETEIDKSVAELIADPLVHLVRNAIDHGIEAPELRVAAGKPRAGRVRLSGAQVGGEVWIRVEDDGRGLDRDAILRRAVERGLVDASAGAALSDAEVYAFIFEPGFSTAARISDVSGRGVGLDVVARNIEQVKGRVDIRSTPGHGSVFTLRIPLTLAIIEGMLLRVGQDSFTVPLLSIRESVVCRPEHVTTLSNGAELVRIRGELLPVLRLHRLFGLHPATEALHEGILLVVEDGGDAVCLFVDQLVGQRQTVIKAVSGFLGNVRGIAGCTVLGDGRISLVLDVGALVRRQSLAA